MAVDIGIRIKADNMTGRDFDKLVGDLKRTGSTTEQVSRSAKGFENRIGDMRSQLRNVTLGTGAWTTAIGVVGKSFAPAAIEVEGITNGLTALERSAEAAETQLSSLQEVMRQPGVGYQDAVKTAGQLKAVNVEADLADRTISEFENSLALVGNQVNLEQIGKQIEAEGLALSQLPHSESAESEHAKRIVELTAHYRQVEIDFERQKTRIHHEEVQKRTQYEEAAAQLRIDYENRVAAARLKAHNAFYGENGVLNRTLQEIAEQQVFDFKDIAAQNKRTRTTTVFEGLSVSSDEPHETLDRAQDFIALTDGVRESVQQLENGARVFSAVFKREFNETLLSGAKAYSEFVKSLRREASPAELLAESGIDQLELGQAGRDRQFEDELRKAAETYQESENRWIHQEQTYTKRHSGQHPFSLDRLSENTGNLVASVPLDVIDAVTNSVRVRQDGNAEILRLEQETAAEIRSIQESVTLSAEEKAREIERIERQSAVKRIQIENQVSERQRASFQSVVTDFLSGIAQMIAAEAQLALARRATSAISGLFSGGGAAAAAGGVGLLSGVILPLLGGLGIAFGASQLMSRSSPSADVYQRSHYGGAVSGSGGDKSPTVQPSRGQTRVSQEDGTRTLEANLNITVEASGTRLGQANERVQLKTARWGG